MFSRSPTRGDHHAAAAGKGGAREATRSRILRILLAAPAVTLGEQLSGRPMGLAESLTSSRTSSTPSARARPSPRVASVESGAPALASCSCPQCPTTTNAVVEALPGPLVAWSQVTGSCLPWGPLGPVGVVVGAILYRRAALGNRIVAKDASAVETRRSDEVEQGLRDLDALAKSNIPYITATLVLLASIPRTAPGAALGASTAAIGVLAATLAPPE